MHTDFCMSATADRMEPCVRVYTSYIVITFWAGSYWCVVVRRRVGTLPIVGYSEATFCRPCFLGISRFHRDVYHLSSHSFREKKIRSIVQWGAILMRNYCIALLKPSLQSFLCSPFSTMHSYVDLYLILGFIAERNQYNSLSYTSTIDF